MEPAQQNLVSQFIASNYRHLAVVYPSLAAVRLVGKPDFFFHSLSSFLSFLLLSFNNGASSSENRHFEVIMIHC